MGVPFFFIFTCFFAVFSDCDLIKCRLRRVRGVALRNWGRLSEKQLSDSHEIQQIIIFPSPSLRVTDWLKFSSPRFSDLKHLDWSSGWPIEENIRTGVVLYKFISQRSQFSALVISPHSAYWSNFQHQVTFLPTTNIAQSRVTWCLAVWVGVSVYEGSLNLIRLVAC